MIRYITFNMENVSKIELDDCLDLLKHSLYNSFEIQCMQDVNQKPILRTYCLYKTEFGLMPYLKCIKNYKLRSVISNLIAGIRCSTTKVTSCYKFAINVCSNIVLRVNSPSCKFDVANIMYMLHSEIVRGITYLNLLDLKLIS